MSEVNIDPGKGHNFRKYPRQEEVVLVVAGKVEQWIDRQKRVLNPGDSAFVPADVVHASFKARDEPANGAHSGVSLQLTLPAAADSRSSGTWCHAVRALLPPM